MNKQRRCYIFSPPHDGLKACGVLGEEEESCFTPQPWATRAKVLPDRVHPADSIGVNTVGALWLGGIWLPGSNSAPGEDDDNALGESGG